MRISAVSTPRLTPKVISKAPWKPASARPAKSPQICACAESTGRRDGTPSQAQESGTAAALGRSLERDQRELGLAKFRLNAAEGGRAPRGNQPFRIPAAV